jgi:hypothetical protein
MHNRHADPKHRVEVRPARPAHYAVSPYLDRLPDYYGRAECGEHVYGPDADGS